MKNCVFSSGKNANLLDEMMVNTILPGGRNFLSVRLASEMCQTVRCRDAPTFGIAETSRPDLFCLSLLDQSVNSLAELTFPADLPNLGIF